MGAYIHGACRDACRCPALALATGFPVVLGTNMGRAMRCLPWEVLMTSKFTVTLSTPFIDADNPDHAVSVSEGNRMNAMRRALLHFNMALPEHRRVSDIEAWKAYHSLIRFARKSPRATHEGGNREWTLTIERSQA